MAAGLRRDIHLRSTSPFASGVYVGAAVSQGQLIGYSGNTPDVAAHLHFDLKLNGQAYKPEPMSNVVGFGWYGFSVENGIGCWSNPNDPSPYWVSKSCPGGGPWSAWEDLGGMVLNSAPPAAAWDCNRLDVFALGTSNYVWHKWYDGVWHPWENMTLIGTSAPAVASWGPGRLDVFVRGQDGALWHLWFDGVWHNWESLGGYTSVSSPQLEGPGAAAMDAGRLDVVVRGGDNAIWHVWFDGAGWHPWESLGGPFSYGAAASSWGPGRLDVFARDGSGAVQHRAYEGGWSPWENLGGAAGGNPAAASWGPARIDVFIRHQNALTLYHKWWAPGWSSWVQEDPA